MSQTQPPHPEPIEQQVTTLAPSRRLSRRTVIGGSAALGVGLPLVGVGTSSAAANPHPGHGHRRPSASARAAVRFLQGVTDAYHVSGPRMAQSYYDESGLLDVGFTYDNALTIIALLAAGDVGRARSIGDALLGVQESDGRLRQAYFVKPSPPVVAADPFGFTGTAVGDMSWAGVALARLARVTRVRKYSDGAVKIGNWIQRNTYSTTGLGGYTFGLTAGLEDHKSTEHNIDAYALFLLLARLTRNRRWVSRARHARDFVRAVWNEADGFFWTGSDDGSTINKLATQLPLDPQAWSWLAARDARYARALDWAKTNLATTDTPIRINSELTGNYSVTGVSFSSGSLMADVNEPIDPFHGKPDDGAVWFEGTSQLALALEDRNRRGDNEDASRLLAAVASAQGRLGADQTFGGKQIEGGIVAASSPLDTGFGFGYYPHLHIGASSWFVFASLEENPYRF